VQKIWSRHFIAEADTMSRRSKLWVWLICAGAIAAAAVAYARDQPRFSLNPFCGVRFAYRLDVTIEVEGKQYVSAATNELQYNRINTGGSCFQSIGSVLPFRLNDNRLVVVKAYLCQEAKKAFGGGHIEPWDHPSLADAAFIAAMKQHKKVDLASVCVGIRRDRSRSGEARYYDGYFLDSADNPRKWRGFSFDHNPGLDDMSESEKPRIVSAVAEAINRPPEDLLETVAPATLKTAFEGDWSKSPASMFHDRRWSRGSYGETTFHASEERHP
jgi:hypothetical protein